MANDFDIARKLDSTKKLEAEAQANLILILILLQCFAGAMAFDVEYARWLEEQNRQINELRSGVNSHASDAELRIIVDGIMAHYEDIFRLKGNAAKADVFHLLSGMWKTPAERCFLWLGGFRSSELLKVSSLFYLDDLLLLVLPHIYPSNNFKRFYDMRYGHYI